MTTTGRIGAAAAVAVIATAVLSYIKSTWPAEIVPSLSTTSPAGGGAGSVGGRAGAVATSETITLRALALPALSMAIALSVYDPGA